MPSSRSAGADVFGSGPGPAVSHELGALVVEDEQVLVGLNQIDALPGEEPGDMEPGLADLNDSIGGDRGAADAIPADRRIWFRDRGGSAFGVASHACCGVMRPGKP